MGRWKGSGNMTKRYGVFAITEDGKTRYCKSRHYSGISGVVLCFSMNGELEGNRALLFERLANAVEIDEDEYGSYQKEQGKHASLIEINADLNIIRLYEDMGGEWIFREYPFDLLAVEGKLHYLKNLQKGHDSVDKDYMYRHMDLVLGEEPWLQKRRYVLDINGFTAIRVTENGNSEFFMTQIYNTFSSVAGRYRKYCLLNDGTTVSDLFIDKQPLSRQGYSLLSDNFREHSHLKNLIEFDLDNETIKLLKKRGVEWESFSTKDVLEIAEKKYAKNLTDEETAYFGNLLNGQEMPEEQEKEGPIPTM